MTDEAEKAPAKKAPSKGVKAWGAKAIHEGITLPSGQVVSVKVPNLPALMKADAVPNDLIDAAISFASASKLTADMLKDQWDFIRWVVPITVVDPEVTEDDVDTLPAEDVEMVAAFAARTTDVDAVGHHLGGLETSAAWRKFRGQLDLDEDLGGL
jgi:hypothetical protein